MYIKKILLTIVLLGLIAGGAFAYLIYNALFSPNTAFNNKEAYIYIKTGSSYDDLKGLCEFQPLQKCKIFCMNAWNNAHFTSRHVPQIFNLL